MGSAVQRDHRIGGAGCFEAACAALFILATAGLSWRSGVCDLLGRQASAGRNLLK
jgi:hypothetical protein